MFFSFAKKCFEFFTFDFAFIFVLSFVISLIGYFVRKIMEHDKSDD